MSQQEKWINLLNECRIPYSASIERNEIRITVDECGRRGIVQGYTDFTTTLIFDGVGNIVEFRIDE